MRYILCALLLFLAAAPALSQTTTTVQAVSKPEYALLQRIFNVHILEDEDHRLTLRVFEVEAPGAEINGDILLLSITPWDAKQPGRVWNTGLEVAAIQIIDIRPGMREAAFKARVQTLQQDGRVDTVLKAFALKYQVQSNGGVSPELEVLAE